MPRVLTICSAFLDAPSGHQVSSFAPSVASCAAPVSFQSYPATAACRCCDCPSSAPPQSFDALFLLLDDHRELLDSGAHEFAQRHYRVGARRVRRQDLLARKLEFLVRSRLHYAYRRENAAKCLDFQTSFFSFFAGCEA